MAWTAPRTWVAGEKPTAAIMNLHIRDNLLYVRYVAPAAVVYGSGWSDIGGGETSAAERVGGMVSAYIAATKSGASTAGEVVCTLPASCRPNRKVRGWCNNAGDRRPVSIYTNGEVGNDIGFGAGLAAMVGTLIFPGA